MLKDRFLKRKKIFFLMKRKSQGSYGKRLWRFFWYDDSVLSWIANIIVAFLLIRYLVYPVLGIILGTNFPLVAVISESMEHGLYEDKLCGKEFKFFYESFDNYWSACGSWYEEHGIFKEVFLDFPFLNGFDKGDVIILWRAKLENLQVGDVLVFQSNKPQPIIHRLVRIWQEEGETFYQTKGDHNGNSFTPIQETKIEESRILGKGMVRIPYLGWVKILFVYSIIPLFIFIYK